MRHVCDDCMQDVRAPGLDVCHGCSDQGRKDAAEDCAELELAEFAARERKPCP